MINNYVGTYITPLRNFFTALYKAKHTLKQKQKPTKQNKTKQNKKQTNKQKTKTKKKKHGNDITLK